MSYQPFRREFDVVPGAVAGVATYLLGVAVTAVAWESGLHPDRGVWTQQPRGLVDYVVQHAGIHVPSFGGTLRGEVLVYTVVWIYLLVAAGFVVSRNGERRGGFKTGASVAVGYLAATVAAVLFLEQRLPAPVLSEAFVPMVVVGLVYPVLFGGLGGLLAEVV